MSRILLFLAIAASVAACNFDKQPQGAEGNISANNAVIITSDQAMQLAARGNCLACHRMDARLGGPAWREVGIRYGSDLKAAPAIASHIKKGGSFGWNLGFMPMRGEGQLTDAEIDSLAKFIATLKADDSQSKRIK